MNGTRSQPPSWLELHVSSSAGLLKFCCYILGIQINITILYYNTMHHNAIQYNNNIILRIKINFCYGVGMPHANVLINVC